jgi:hypothetical protein
MIDERQLENILGKRSQRSEIGKNEVHFEKPTWLWDMWSE